MPSSKRPPRLAVSTQKQHQLPILAVDDDEQDILQLSSPESISPTSASDDLASDLAMLEQLRKNVQKNLKLRPIRSRSNLRKLMDEDEATSAQSAYFTPLESFPAPLSARFTGSIDPDGLASRLGRSKRPLLIDTRSLPAFQSARLVGSVNISIPSLILKRCRKPGGGIQSLDSLRQFVTSDAGKDQWDSKDDRWDGDVIVFDDQMAAADTAWSLVRILAPLTAGSVLPLLGGFSEARNHPKLQDYIQNDEDAVQPKSSAGLFKLNTQAAAASKPLPEIETSSPVYSPLVAPVLAHIHDSSPSPPPHHINFSRTPPRKSSAPALQMLDTKPSTERLNGQAPLLRLRTKPANLTVPPHSPSQLPSPIHSPSDYVETYYASPPMTPRPPPSPRTARQASSDQPPTTEDPFPGFIVSCILPDFLFLGPEPQETDHVSELQTIGVKRILNLAIECESDDHGLDLRNVFERYDKIAMRDTVEEDNITQGVRQVCRILDDARLHSAPTYVHCKVGKSRSVTAVMAYLIHANHWTLSRAYAFVLERRKGISPNIGFVSELMAFEEQELGNKSVGVVQTSGAGVRESLPPVLTHTNTADGLPGPVSAGGAMMVTRSGQEMEVKDENGRYRHVRRAPVDETTLQPVRRVSKAGLETSSFH